MNVKSRIAGVAVAMAICLSSGVQAHAAGPSSGSPMNAASASVAGSQVNTEAADEQRILEIIANAKATDRHFLKRRAVLEASDGFNQIMDGASSKARSVYLDFFTAVSSNSDIRKFANKSKGKYLVVVEVNGQAVWLTGKALLRRRPTD